MAVITDFIKVAMTVAKSIYSEVKHAMEAITRQYTDFPRKERRSKRC